MYFVTNLIWKTKVTAANNIFSAASTNSSNTLEESPRIIGGTKVVAGEYPWYTMLLSTNFGESLECGGSLIAEEWVLTAAHCLTQRFRNSAAVRVGALNAPYTQGDNGGQKVEFFRLRSIIAHPTYNSNTENNDFALLRLNGKATITPVPIDGNKLSDGYSTGKLQNCRLDITFSFYRQ